MIDAACAARAIPANRQRVQIVPLPAAVNTADRPRPTFSPIILTNRMGMDSIQHHDPDILVLVGLYAKMSEMRVVSSPEVLAAAENVVGRLIETYSMPDISLTEIQLKTFVRDGSFDLLRDFSESCRAEFDRLRAQRL